MSKKLTPLEKAVNYLAGGKIQVQTHDDSHARLLATGSGPRPYTVTFDQSGWMCDCPAQVAECAHILAAKLISPLRPSQALRIGRSDPDLDAFFAQFEHATSREDDDGYEY